VPAVSSQEVVFVHSVQINVHSVGSKTPVNDVSSVHIH
jgi:hypothetical protein